MADTIPGFPWVRKPWQTVKRRFSVEEKEEEPGKGGRVSNVSHVGSLEALKWKVEGSRPGDSALFPGCESGSFAALQGSIGKDTGVEG